MEKAKIFQNGQSQAVRLPKEFRFNSKEVWIKRMGNAVVLIPLEGTWDTLIASLDMFPPDFMLDRQQPKNPQIREPIE